MGTTSLDSIYEGLGFRIVLDLLSPKSDSIQKGSKQSQSMRNVCHESNPRRGATSEPANTKRRSYLVPIHKPNKDTRSVDTSRSQNKNDDGRVDHARQPRAAQTNERKREFQPVILDQCYCTILSK